MASATARKDDHPDPEEFFFDGYSLHKLIIENKIIRDGRVPSREKLFRLAFELQALRQFVSHLRMNKYGLDIPRREAAAALQRLRELLPFLREQLLLESRFLGEADPSKGLAEIDVLVAAVNDVTHEARLFAMSDFCTGRANIETWNDYAPRIAQLFKDVFAEVNPEKQRLGNSYDGPVATFLASVIPKISGETATPAAVSKHLQRKSREDSQPI